jgi:homogentisate 1,2-dioxygenase
MSEYMGMIYGKYDAKSGGFLPGGGSLHLPMTPHGPDAGVFDKHSVEGAQSPEYFTGGLAFMFETTHILKVSVPALSSPLLQRDYTDCWKGLKCNFAIDGESKDDCDEMERKRARK